MADSAQGTSLTLLERARAHDEQAWTRLVRLYEPMIRSWCRRGGLQESDVNDVVQEVCRSALSDWPTSAAIGPATPSADGCG